MQGCRFFDGAGRISRCEILNNGVITRNKMSPYLCRWGANGDNRRCVEISRLVETLIARIARCEVLAISVIIKSYRVDAADCFMAAAIELIFIWGMFQCRKK